MLFPAIRPSVKQAAIAASVSAKFNAITTAMSDFKAPSHPERPKPYRPPASDQFSEGRFEGDTTFSTAYKQWPVQPYELPVWAKKHVYRKPTGGMITSSLYRVGIKLCGMRYMGEQFILMLITLLTYNACIPGNPQTLCTNDSRNFVWILKSQWFWNMLYVIMMCVLSERFSQPWRHWPGESSHATAQRQGGHHLPEWRGVHAGNYLHEGLPGVGRRPAARDVQGDWSVHTAARENDSGNELHLWFSW